MDTGTTAITDIHLALIVILAIAAVAAIVWGMRLKRARIAAAERFEINQDETRDATAREQAELGDDPLHADTPTPAAPQAQPTQVQSQSQVQSAPVAPTPAPIPVAPSLPPIADEPAPGTPPEMSTAQANAGDRPVTALKGLGPKVAAALAACGITTVGQIAALDTNEAEALDAGLGAFRGRMARDRWIEQARFLAAGDVAGFEQVFGRL